MDRLQVVFPRGDWWTYIEQRVHGASVQPASPTQRAATTYTPRPPVAFPRLGSLRLDRYFDRLGDWLQTKLRPPGPPDYWLVDLHIDGIGPDAKLKLTQYLQARRRRDPVLRALFNNFRDSQPGWEALQPGLAVAAYAQQHRIPRRFVSMFATTDNPPLRTMLHYLAHTHTPMDSKPFHFVKSRLAASEKAGLSDEERDEYQALYDWIRRHGKADPSRPAIQRYVVTWPVRLTREDLYFWAQIIIGIIASLVVAMIGLPVLLNLAS